jgi:hypothetical protein
MGLNKQTNDHPNLLSQSRLDELDVRFGANARKWLADHAPTARAKLIRKEKSAQGRKPKLILNPLYGFIGLTTYWGRYPAFAMDVIEGVARLDWHDRPIEAGGKSNPLSVRNLVVILEQLPMVFNEAVEDLFQLRERHARRYVKATELIIPRVLLSLPEALRNEMLGDQPDQMTCQWADSNGLHALSPAELERLHRDLQAPTRYKTAEEYEAEYEAELSGSPMSHQTSTNLPTRKDHPQKANALVLLDQGEGVRAIARKLGVSTNTVSSWNELPRLKQAAA